MKIFERDGKFNWVDENNVLLGFSSDQNCCEDFGYQYLSDEPDMYDERNDSYNYIDLDGYVFDVNFFKNLESGSILDCGGAVCFRLVNKINDKELFLVLYNAHNGYYSHGFEIGIKGQPAIHEGYL